MTRALRCLAGLTTFAFFGACGGAQDPNLFNGSSAGDSATGNGGSEQAGSVAQAGTSGDAPATGGDGSRAGASHGSAGSPAAGHGGMSSAGADQGGTSSAGAGDGGASSAGAGHGGTSSAGTGHGGTSSAGAGHGGTGSTGMGGHGNAGAGSGGAAGSAGATSQSSTCAALLALAKQQLADARACNMAMNAPPCTGKVSTVCGCEVPVHQAESAETEAYTSTLKEIRKAKCAEDCPQIACSSANGGSCEPVASGSVIGVCSASAQ